MIYPHVLKVGVSVVLAGAVVAVAVDGDVGMAVRGAIPSPPMTQADAMGVQR